MFQVKPSLTKWSAKLDNICGFRKHSCFVVFYLRALANMGNVVWYSQKRRSVVKNKTQMSCSSEQMWLGISGRNNISEIHWCLEARGATLVRYMVGTRPWAFHKPWDTNF